MIITDEPETRMNPGRDLLSAQESEVRNRANKWRSRQKNPNRYGLGFEVMVV
jgi:hypothetical protein